MNARVILLRRLLKRHSEEDIKKLVGRYVPYRSEVNDDFLVSSAIIFEKRVIGRTYLLFGDDDSTLGYFTVGIKSVVIPGEMSDEVSNSFRRGMNLVDRSAQSFK